ncbi:LacI family DNA-binding transcriptional regulator [Cytobacillus spongiae]|uniref:LacI family DNA-binding transcriptional regulator n=1 Tax=Cytobacillus spongiae TaxID=2901381 RepID=UPI001F402CCE|nr:LacI family DNA-binding transcriptional regulator [Cytobacillus spongiae]UII54279.1 LacI family DNA-binding transcriptional regulator [Cytobacillus spongiae]
MVITIKDVAKQANVAPSTVSRVIANHPRISEKTKKRVREVMKELGYHPNLQARSLAARSSQTIGVVMPNSAFFSFQNPFFPEVLRGISTSAHDHKYGLYLTTGTTEDEIFEEVISMVNGKRVDGIILLYSRINDRALHFLYDADFPFTIVGTPYCNDKGITHVDNDNINTTKRVTNYLIELGHERIAFIGGNLGFVVTNDRLNGYKMALEEAGLTFDKQYYVEERMLKESGKEAIEFLMSLPSPPTALVTQDDLMAYEMISHLEKLNIKVPDDISVISFNNLTLSEHSKPPLTSVDINIYDLGLVASNCLIEKIKDPTLPAKRITIPTELIERDSCQPVKEIVRS